MRRASPTHFSVALTDLHFGLLAQSTQQQQSQRHHPVHYGRLVSKPATSLRIFRYGTVSTSVQSSTTMLDAETTMVDLCMQEPRQQPSHWFHPLQHREHGLLAVLVSFVEPHSV